MNSVRRSGVQLPVVIAAAKQDIFEADFGTGQMQTCVRPVCAAHAAAGPPSRDIAVQCPAGQWMVSANQVPNRSADK